MRHFARIIFASLILGAACLPQGEVSGQSISDRLTLNGFLSQAYGDATEYPIYGLPTGGTGDYRTLALQARFAITNSDFVVVQVNHRALGESALGALQVP